MNAIAQPRTGFPGFPDDPGILAAAVQVIHESLAIVAAGIIVYANPACCLMFEFADASQLLGRPIADIIPAYPLAIVPAAAAGAHRNHEEEFVHARRDGTHLHLGATRTCFRLRDSEFQIVQMRDLGEQNATEMQLREAQSLADIGRLAGGVAHDFNNLLTGLMLYCDLLIGELNEGSRPYRHAREMRAAGEHGGAIVRQLLALTRPSGEPMQLFSLNDVIRSMEDLLRRLIGENIVLCTVLAVNLDAVRMGPAQVQQILLNLVLNARDAMPGGGRITLSTRNSLDSSPLRPESPTPMASWVELIVSDTGCGMDAATLDRAFEPFFTSKAPGRGNGLGLATARRLAEEEGGTISAESEPGKGSKVSLRLPRAQSDAAANSKVER